MKGERERTHPLTLNSKRGEELCIQQPVVRIGNSESLLPICTAQPSTETRGHSPHSTYRTSKVNLHNDRCTDWTNTILTYVNKMADTNSPNFDTAYFPSNDKLTITHTKKMHHRDPDHFMKRWTAETYQWWNSSTNTWDKWRAADLRCRIPQPEAEKAQCADWKSASAVPTTWRGWVEFWPFQFNQFWASCGVSAKACEFPRWNCGRLWDWNFPDGFVPVFGAYSPQGCLLDASGLTVCCAARI